MLYPATVLKQAGFQVKITDCIVEKLPLNEALEEDVDVYIFYSVFLSREVDLETSSLIEKEKGPKTPIIYLGSDPTYYPEKYLKSANRLVVRGEPEYTLLELIGNLDGNISQVKGVSWKKDGSIQHNSPRKYIEDLDKLPFPDRSLLKKPYRYYNAKFKNLPSTTMLTSRGCSFHCYYCVPNSLSFARELEWKRWYHEKPPVKKRSPENVIREFKEIACQGCRAVAVLDDEFLWERERTFAILDGIRGLNLEISILARPDMITDLQLTQKMAYAGIRHIDLGTESFSQKILNYIKKDLDISTISSAIKLIKKAGIKPEINLLFGSCPLETKESIKHSIRQAEAMKVDIIHAQICTPFPGTDFHERAKKEGWMITKEYIPIDPAWDALISYPHLTRDELIRTIHRFYHKHYFNPCYLLRQLFTIRSWRELIQKIKTAKNIWRNIIHTES